MRKVTLGLTVLVLGAAMIGPALAGPSDPVTTKAFKAFKKQMKKQLAERVTRAEADALYLAAGEIRIRELGTFALGHGYTVGSVQHHSGTVVLASPNNTGASFSTYLTEPNRLGGRGYRLQSVEACYQMLDASPSGDVITATRVNDLGSASSVINDPTFRGSHVATCYTVSPPAPYAPQGALQLQIEVFGDQDTLGEASIRGITTTWVPS